jgi:hypothetical protein
MLNAIIATLYPALYKGNTMSQENNTKDAHPLGVFQTIPTDILRFLFTFMNKSDLARLEQVIIYIYII